MSTPHNNRTVIRQDVPMRYSQMFIPTVKETPADAEIPSHQLMIRAGLIRKVASGTYTYLPLGFRCLNKVINIIRQEMEAAGAQEILMPAIQPIELWQQTGRDADYGPTMCRFQDRHNRVNVLAPTAEEVVTAIAAGELKSYKQLPMNLYQISPKFRDEFRPRFGVLRSREFMMKDAYSFHADEQSLQQTYQKMYDTYCRIFKRCGLEYVIVEAETGEMGGSASHQFSIPCENGEDIIVHTEDNSYAANLEKAAVDPLPQQPKPQDIGQPEDVHTPGTGTIEAVCDFLKTKPAQMIKTLIYKVEDQIVLALVRGDHDLNAEKFTVALDRQHNELADEKTIEQFTGAAVGFAGPIGLLEKASKVIIDQAVAVMPVAVSGANKTDYHTANVVPGRDFPLSGANIQIADIRNAVEGDTYKGKKLLFKRGIEVGQVFKLGTKYSSKLGAKVLDENGSETLCTMGCYGIGVNRIIASAVELRNDKFGIIWPISIAPFEVIITALNQEDAEVVKTAADIYEKLRQKGIDVLLDDRELRPGPKFKDADLIGIPIRITVGKKALADGNIELKLRSESKSRHIPVTDALSQTLELVESLYAD